MKKYLTMFLFFGLCSLSQNLSLKADNCCLSNNGSSSWYGCIGPCNGLNPACIELASACPSNAKRIILTPEQFRHHQEIMKEYQKSNPSD